MIDTPAPIEATQIILEEYLRVLEVSCVTNLIFWVSY